MISGSRFSLRVILISGLGAQLSVCSIIYCFLIYLSACQVYSGFDLRIWWDYLEPCKADWLARAALSLTSLTGPVGLGRYQRCHDLDFVTFLFVRAFILTVYRLNLIFALDMRSNFEYSVLMYHFHRD